MNGTNFPGFEANWLVPRRSDAMASDVLLPQETVSIREEVRSFAKDVLSPIAHDLNSTPERRDGFRHDVFNAIARSGLFEIPFPKDVGGRGLTYPTIATLTVVEELAYYSAGIASSMYDAHAILVGKTLDTAGGDLRTNLLPRLIRGEFVGAFATSEPNASTDLSVKSVKTIAVETEGGWLVSGTKRWITNSVAADFMILLCRTGASLSLLLVDMHKPGIKVSDPDLKMGNNSQLTADVELQDVFIPHGCMLGLPGEGLRSALASLALGRMGIGAVGVGLAQRAFDVAVEYSSKREVYEKPIAAFQHWQFRFAELAMELEAARSLYQKAGAATDAGENIAVLSAMAKIKGSTIAVDMAREAVQVCGAYGFARQVTGSTQTWPLEAIYRDAKIGEIYEGANEIQKWIVARKIFGRKITG